jgi:hypothetical protein
MAPQRTIRILSQGEILDRNNASGKLSGRIL